MASTALRIRGLSKYVGRYLNLGFRAEVSEGLI